MRVAVVHDWLVTYGGAERVLEQVLDLYPEADLLTLLDCVPASQRSFIRGRSPSTSFLQHVPGLARNYQKLLPLMPAAIERFDLEKYDLVISLSFAVAKGVLTTPDQLHICYLQARNLKYAYEDRRYYRSGSVIRLVQDIQLSRLRVWDSVASRRPDITIANSQFVRRWHMHRHGVAAEVIYPPVDTAHYAEHFRAKKDDYFVTVGRLEPYKRMDLVIEAFNRLGRKLIVIGAGTQGTSLKGLAKPNIEFLGYCTPDVIADSLAGARAFVFASGEDFGIAPLEAQACGTPVVAYQRGGAAETIRGLTDDDPTGLLFEHQTVEGVMDAVHLLDAEQHRIAPEACRSNALRFTPERFRREFAEFVAARQTDFEISRRGEGSGHGLEAT